MSTILPASSFGPPVIPTLPWEKLSVPGHVSLRLVETTDLHMHLFPYDYYTASRSPGTGLALAAGVIARLRAASPNLMLFDNGDFLQGSPLGDYAAARHRSGRPDLHPAIAAMNGLRYDAVALGNHEFNYGLPFLERSLAGAAFPVVSANAVTRLGAGPRDDRTLVAPCALLDRIVVDGAGQPHPIRIGVIGLVPPQTAIWDREHVAGRVVFRDMVETAAALVPQMREAGADLIVALAHTGIGAAQATAGMENAAIPLAAIPGIDVLMLGHAHLVFPAPHHAARPGVDAAAGLINGKPAVMAGCFGSHLGIVDLRLARDGGGWRTLAARSQAQPMAARGANGTLRADAPGQTAFLAGARNLHAATRRYMARPVGQTGQPLSSHFALVADTAALRLVAAAMADHVRAALKGTGLAGLPVVAAAAPFKAGGRGGPFNFTDIPAGPLARRHVADLYPFTNTICAVLVSGAGLRDWLERSAALYRRLRRGDADQPLIDPDFPSYNFDMMLGLRYRVAPARPALFDAEGRRLRSGPGRILDLRHRGRAIAATDRFVVATNSYRLATWRTGPGCPAPEVVAEAPLQVREVLAHWIAAQAGPVPLPPPGWSLCLPPGAGVLFDTSPLADPSALSPLAATRLGPAPGGFARFRLSA